MTVLRQLFRGFVVEADFLVLAVDAEPVILERGIDVVGGDTEPLGIRQSLRSRQRHQQGQHQPEEKQLTFHGSPPELAKN